MASLLMAQFLTVAGLDWSPRPPIYDIAGQKSLYSAEGPVHLLQGPGCDLSQSWQGHPWLVEYYHSSCPHCWYFAPVFHQLAAAYRGSSLHVAACNCAAEENRAGCDAMQIFRYPSLQVFSGNASARKLFDVEHSDKEGRVKSAQQVVAWLSAHALPKPLHPEAAEQGADFASAPLAPGAPPGRPGWPWDFHPEEDRAVEARLGLLALLQGSDKEAPARRVVALAARSCLQGCRRDEQLVQRLRVKPLQPELERWAGLFARREHVFCKDETCSVWQLFHSVAGAVAAAELGLRAHARPPSAAEALAFFREAVDEFLFCDFCREHFLRSYDSCEYGRCEILSSEQGQGRRLVLWLWRLHNAVSMRVLREHPAKQAVDRRWPTYRDCPGCWKASVVNGEVVNEDDLDSAFDLERTFGFLLSNYVGRANVENHLESKILIDAPTQRDDMGMTFIMAALGVVGGLATLLWLARLRRQGPYEAFE